MGLFDAFKKKKAKTIPKPPEHFDLHKLDDVASTPQPFDAPHPDSHPLPSFDDMPDVPAPPGKQFSKQELPPEPFAKPKPFPQTIPKPQAMPPQHSFPKEPSPPESFAPPQPLPPVTQPAPQPSPLESFVPPAQESFAPPKPVPRQEKPIVTPIQPPPEYNPYPHEHIDKPQATDFGFTPAEQHPAISPPTPLMSTMRTDNFELFVNANDYSLFVTSMKNISRNLKEANGKLKEYTEKDDAFKQHMIKFHDTLDFMQQKLMYVDTVLFER